MQQHVLLPLFGVMMSFISCSLSWPTATGNLFLPTHGSTQFTVSAFYLLLALIQNWCAVVILIS
jgi:hypothetical protein